MKNKTKRIWFSIFIMTIILSLTGCRNNQTELKQQPSSWTTIKKNKKVVIGLDDSFVPMGFRQRDNTLAGYDIDLAKAVFKQYGIKVDFQTIDWSMNVSELRNQTIDLIWNGLTVTKERNEKLTFSRPYLVNEQVLVVKKNSGIKTLNDMQDKSLGAQSGSSGAQDLDNYPNILKNKIKDNKPVLYDSFNNAFIDLNAKRIQGLLIDSVYANYYLQHQANANEFIILKSHLPNEKFAVGIKKDNIELKEKIDAALEKLEKEGYVDKLNKKWFGTNK